MTEQAESKPLEYHLERPALLVVEGGDDFHVTLNLAESLSLPETFGVMGLNGKDSVIHSLKMRLEDYQDGMQSSNQKTHLGVVLDANTTGAAATYQRVQKHLQNHGYNPPENLDPQGLVIPGKDVYPVFGLWIMPDNQSTGDLEKFLFRALPAEKRAALEDLLKQAQAVPNLTSYKKQHHAKALVHTYLALQDEPGFPLGIGVTAKAFDLKNSDIQAFAMWLKRLFAMAE